MPNETRTIRRAALNIRAMVETALFVAMASVLALIPLPSLPQGGTVTVLSMLPILMIGIRRGTLWGLGGAVVYSAIQMLSGFYPPPTPDFTGFLLVILLDYVIAFGVLGFSGLFSRRKYGIVYGAAVCITLRFLCHFASGMVIWGIYAEDVPVWIYSLVYNGSYMGIELLATTAAAFLICKTAPKLLIRQD